MSDIILVGCVQQKLDRQAPAADLYTSPLFRKRRAYAEATGKPWAILSALHGLVMPETPLYPYDFGMDRHGPVSARRWALHVVYELDLWVGTANNQLVEVHAGAAYVEPLQRAFRGDGAFTMLTPMKGLQIGQQLAWYRRGE